MAEITAQMVKELRERSGAGIMECKRALSESGGDIDEAELVLRKRGIDVAQKKASRTANEGSIGSYIHAGSKLGVLVEINCETDFVARTDDFQSLVHDVAMHVAAADPRFISKDEVTEEAVQREKMVQRERALAEGKPEKIVDKIVDGRMGKFYEEVCLLEQPFVKDNSTTVGEMITAQIAKMGENITVSRIARFKVGEAGS
ncbi:MAG: elongation factor Ts [Solibacterales bacterium]|nr:elongation factor Ts [Bryobacterales bacterium]|tara:strand:- start:232 stop:837 length:606 start_codon:yes stop_codon:yes gene_type:complete